MFEKTTFAAFFLFALFGSSHGLFAVGPSANEGYRLKQEFCLIYAGPQESKSSLRFSAHKKSIQTTGNEEFEELEDELEELIEEMKKLEKEARQKLIKEILPRIKEEIKKLRDKLRKWHDEEDESGPIGVEATEI